HLWDRPGVLLSAGLPSCLDLGPASARPSFQQESRGRRPDGDVSHPSGWLVHISSMMPAATSIQGRLAWRLGLLFVIGFLGAGAVAFARYRAGDLEVPSRLVQKHVR